MLKEIFVAIVIIFAAVIVRYYWIWFRFIRKVGFMGPIPLPFIGNNYSVVWRPGMVKFDKYLHEKYHGVAPIMDFWVPQLVVTDVEVLKQVQIRDFASFTDRGMLNLLHKPLSLNLLQLAGPRWKRVRSIVTPTFTSGKLKQIYPQILTLVNYCLGQLGEAAEAKSPVNAKTFFGFYTAGNIISVAFGLDFISATQADRKLLPKLLDDAFTKVSAKNWRMFASFFFPYFFSPQADKNGDAPFAMVPRADTQYFVGILDRVYKERCEGYTRNDYFQLLLNARAKSTDSTDMKNEADSKLSKDELYSNVAVFLYAGYETTMTALAFTSMLLVSRPDIQEECAQEAEAALATDGSKEIQYDHLSMLPLTEAVLKESMRLYTPVRRFYRECTQDTHLAGMEIEKGTQIQVTAHVIHRLPEIWGPDAEEFNPKRFFTRSGEDPAFQGFGMGQRSCVGERFAMIEAKVLLATILMKYRFVRHEKSVIPPVADDTVFPKPIGDLIFAVEERKPKISHS